jgi:hypothetical protein
MTTSEPARYQSETKARKLWLCSECGGKIWPGQWYTYEADRGPGTNVKRICETCRPIKEKP